MRKYIKIKDLGPLKSLKFSKGNRKESKIKTKSHVSEDILKEFKNTNKYNDIKFITESEKGGDNWKNMEIFKENISNFDVFVKEKMLKTSVEDDLDKIKKNISQTESYLTEFIEKENTSEYGNSGTDLGIFKNNISNFNFFVKETKKISKSNTENELSIVENNPECEKIDLDFSIKGIDDSIQIESEENEGYKIDEQELTKNCHEEFIKYIYVKNEKSEKQLNEYISLLESRKNILSLLYKVHLENNSNYETELDKFLDRLKKGGDDVLKFIGDPFNYSEKSRINENNFYFMVKNFVKLNDSNHISSNNTMLFSLITLQTQFEETYDIKQMCSNGDKCHCKKDFDFICKYFDLENVTNNQKICLYCYIVIVNTFYYINRMKCLDSNKINDFGFICDDYSGIKSEYTLYQDKTPFYGLTSHFIRHHRSYYELGFNDTLRILRFKDIIFFVGRAVLKNL